MHKAQHTHEFTRAFEMCVIECVVYPLTGLVFEGSKHHPKARKGQGSGQKYRTRKGGVRGCVSICTFLLVKQVN